MKITKKTRKSHYWNEDRFVVGQHFLMVIDGATPLVQEQGFNSACWLVNYLKKHLINYHGDIKTKLLELSKKGIEEIPLKNKTSDYLPSASMSFIEFDKNLAKISILGDCEVVIKYLDGSIKRFYNESLSKLDNVALDEMIRLSSETNLPLIECRPLISDTLIKHRRLINHESGYKAYTLGLDKLLFDEYELSLNNVQEIYLYSDGFSQNFQHLQIYNSYLELFQKSLDLNMEIKKIEERAFSDKSCDKYPRFKVIDDITIIKAVL